MSSPIVTCAMMLFSEGKQRNNGPGGAGRCRGRGRDWREGCSWNALSERINEKKKGEGREAGKEEGEKKAVAYYPNI